jgi:hypothetical protein
MTIVWEVQTKLLIKHVTKDEKRIRCGKRRGKNFINDSDLPDAEAQGWQYCLKCWRDL